MNRVDDNSKIWAVVLAAGESKRMESPKLVLPYRGKTIIENVILNILESDLSKIVVVTGAWRNVVLEAISGLPVRHCNNDDFLSGMLSSAICGLNSLPAEAEAAMIFQGDQPDIKPDVINKMIMAWKIERKGIVIPVYDRKRGHPLLIGRKYFGIVSKLDPGTGLRGLMSGFLHDITEVDVDNAMILRDIDTKEDYLESINKKQ